MPQLLQSAAAVATTTVNKNAFIAQKDESYERSNQAAGHVEWMFTVRSPPPPADAKSKRAENAKMFGRE
jgi:hypothetical protein